MHAQGYDNCARKIHVNSCFALLCVWQQMKDYLKDVHGFEDQNITLLMDDGENTEPTKANIMAAYEKLVNESEPGDVVFCHFSGKCMGFR